MRLSNGYTCFTGIALVLGGILPVIGMAIRPLLVEQNFNFQPADFDTISAHHAIWILSYQVMVFGLFVRLAGLVALGSLHSHTLARTVVWPGVAIALVATVINGISAGANFGASKISAVGEVYDLKKLADFPGTYVQLEGAITLAGGVGGTVLKNQNGVIMRLQSTSQGLQFNLSSSGVTVKMEP